MLYRLRTSGYKAYLVGGSVRDLLLSRVPKDFDIGTDAHPPALRKLFRNCRMIGRRFRLAHILFANGKVVEVATFRARPDPAAAAGGAELLQTSDNTFGTPREDALRRDFTINGLFYDISDFSVIDYVGGLEDLEAGLVRTIGDPDIRFQEDPVRMMRAVEFASRLGFAITPDAYEAILRHRKEIVKSAPPRVTEELAQALRGGHALPTLLLMREVGLLDALLPELASVLRELDPDHPSGTGTPVLGAARGPRRGAPPGPQLRRRAPLRAPLRADRAGARSRGVSRGGTGSRAPIGHHRGRGLAARPADVAAARGDRPHQAGPLDRREAVAPARLEGRDPPRRLPGGVPDGARPLRADRHGDRPSARRSCATGEASRPASSAAARAARSPPRRLPRRASDAAAAAPENKRGQVSNFRIALDRPKNRKIET